MGADESGDPGDKRGHRAAPPAWKLIAAMVLKRCARPEAPPTTPARMRSSWATPASREFRSANSLPRWPAALAARRLSARVRTAPASASGSAGGTHTAARRPRPASRPRPRRPGPPASPSRRNRRAWTARSRRNPGPARPGARPMPSTDARLARGESARGSPRYPAGGLRHPGSFPRRGPSPIRMSRKPSPSRAAASTAASRPCASPRFPAYVQVKRPSRSPSSADRLSSAGGEVRARSSRCAPASPFPPRPGPRSP